MKARTCEPNHTSSTLFRRRASVPLAGLGLRRGGNQKKPASQPNPLNQFGRRRVQSPLELPLLPLVGVMYFHDKGTNRRVMLIGLMFCTAFVLVSFFARPQPENDRVLVKADRLTLTAGKPPLAN
jgi:hypothetical protein